VYLTVGCAPCMSANCHFYVSFEEAGNPVSS
jgi:hypothetical protein